MASCTAPSSTAVPPNLGGKGLWLVNQVCDLVEMRSTTDGTTICLHMKLR